MPIRLSQPNDIEAVKNCAEQAYAKYVERIGRKPAPMVADFAAHQLAGQLYVLVTDANAVCGYIVFFPKERSMFLENLAVVPNQYGKGFGQKLVRFCEEAAKKSNLEKVRLYTNEAMVENFGFYAALGYKEVERKLEDGFHRVYFEKRISYAKDNA